jgi:hypothetical protein
MNFTTLQKTNRQAGMALILAIGLLAVLSILGAVIMNIATRDLSETAATLPNQRALYAADRSIEYSMNRDIIVNLPVMGSLDLATDHVISAAGTTLAATHKQVIDGLGPGTLISGKVSDVGPGSLPPHMAAIHGSEFGANMYHVDVETTATLGKKVHVDASIVRLFKLDDDQIFRTSGGG